MLDSLKRLLLAPDPRRDLETCDQVDWALRFRPESPIPDDLILSHARAVYAEVDLSGERIDAKAASLLTFAGTLATILVAAAGVVKPATLWPVFPSLVCFCATVGLCILARRPAFRGGLPRIRDVMLAWEQMHDGQAVSLACSLHGSVVNTELRNRWKSRLVEFASWVAFAGVAWFPVMLAIWLLT